MYLFLSSKTFWSTRKVKVTVFRLWTHDMWLKLDGFSKVMQKIVLIGQWPRPKRATGALPWLQMAFFSLILIWQGANSTTGFYKCIRRLSTACCVVLSPVLPGRLLSGVHVQPEKRQRKPYSCTSHCNWQVTDPPYTNPLSSTPKLMDIMGLNDGRLWSKSKFMTIPQSSTARWAPQLLRLTWSRMLYFLLFHRSDLPPFVVNELEYWLCSMHLPKLFLSWSINA